MGSSANPQEYQDWITYGVDLNRDVVYFFGESPDGEGNSIYRMYVDHVNGNMVRDDNTPNREEMQFRLRVVEIASQIGDNPRDLVMRGDELFFVVDDASWGSEVVKVDKSFSTVPGSVQTPRLVSDINRDAGNSDPQELTVVGDQVYFTATDGVRRELFTAAPDDLTLSRFSQVPNSPAESDRLAPFGNRLTFVGSGSLWTTSGAEAAPIGNGSSPTTTLEIGLLAEAGDGLVTSADRTATLSFQQTVNLVGGEIVEPIDLTELVTAALSAGNETLTIRVEAPAEAGELYLLPALETGERLGALKVEVQGVVADLIDEQGYVVARGQSLHDLRNLAAGTYYLRVSRPADSTSTDPITFGVELDAPTLGNAYPTSDRDTIRGGDGNDQILGGPGLDHLLGQEGADAFVAEDLEVFDLNTNVGDTLVAIDSADISNAPVAGPSDTEVLTEADVNPLIRKAIADALGHPTTTDADGNLVFHQPIYASQVAEIEYLDLSGLGLSSAADLSGLEHAIHLRFLDLSDNNLTSVALPAPFNFLQTLNLANNAITNIQPGDLINTPFLRQLFVDGNDIRDLQDLAGAVIVDDGDVGYEEIGIWQNEVFVADSVWLDDYRYAKAGGTAIWNIDSSEGTETELFVTWPTRESETPTEVTYRVMSGGTELFSRTVNQTVPVSEYNTAGEFGGTDWVSLGTFTAGATGLRVELVADVDVVVAADAVRAEAILVPTTSLAVISLLNNPVNDVSRDEWISRIEANGDGPSVIVTPNANAPTINPIDPQKLHHGSLLFDDSAVTLPGELLDGRESFMFEVWFRPSQANISDQFILSAGESSTSNEFFVTHLSNTVIRIGDQDAFFDFTVPSTIDLVDGEWHHYAVTRDLPTRKLRLFVDGQYIGERNLPTSAVAMRVASNGLYLGQNQDEIGGNYNSVQGLRGELDEVRFWDRFWDYAESENHLAAQLKSIAVLKDREARGFDRLLAYYQFDEIDGNQVLDGSVNGWHGELGDLIGNEDRDRRPVPLRAENAPIQETHRFSLPITGSTDLDGEVIRYSAVSDNPEVVATTSGQSVVVEYPANVPQSARITVTTFDENRREARTGFDFVVGAGVEFEVSDPTTATILTFDAGVNNGALIPQAYGDRVTSSTMGNFSYGGAENGPLTPNTRFSYVSNLVYLPSGAGDLLGAAFGNQTSDGVNVALTADPGNEVLLHGFDIAPYAISSRVATTFEITDGLGNVLFAQPGVNILGGSTHSSFDFATPLRAQEIRIRAISSGGLAFAIDNIEFSEASIGSERFNQTTYGTVYFDADESGFRDTGERGVGGMVLHLLDASGNGIACSVTDANGNYRINADLANSVHSIELELPSGWTATSPTTVPIGNRAPDTLINFGISKPINIGADRAGTEGTPESFTVDSNLTLNTFAWVVTLDGNQVAEGDTADFGFTPENEGNYIVTLTAVDASDTAHTDSLLLRVAGAPPVATVNFVGDPVSSIDEGTTLEFNAIVSDAGVSDTIASFKWFVLGSFGQEVGSFSGNLSAGQPVPNWSFEFVDEGNFQILLQLTDNEGLVGISEPISIEVNNVAPVAMLTQSTTTTTTGEVSFSGSFIDPGHDFWTGRADFGDGNTRPIVVRSDKTIEGEYQYTQPGRYTVSVELDDNDGGTSLNTFEVIYDPFAPQQVSLVGSIDEHIDTTDAPIYVGTFEVEDSTLLDSHFFQLVDGVGSDDNLRFVIDGKVLRLKQGEVVDFEVRSEYGIRIRATDQVGNQLESPIEISVSNLPEVSSANIDYLEIGNTVLNLWGNQTGQYDQLRHDGSARLGGTLEIKLIDEFVPASGDVFDLIQVTGAITEQFDRVLLPVAPSGAGWNLVYDDHRLRLQLLSLATVGSVVVSEGQAQRSQVRSLDVLFSGSVDIDNGAFTVFRLNGDEQEVVETAFVASDDGSGNTVARLEFSGPLTRGGGALLDGNYRLVVDASKVRVAGSNVLLDGDGDGQAGGDFQFGGSANDDFFALYGDSDGDRTVGFVDFVRFRNGFGTMSGDVGYLDELDFDDDETIGLLDFVQFRNRFGQSLDLPWFSGFF